MPASRKRNKGKERKAKREVNERLMVRNEWQSWTVRGCDHGCTVNIPDDHPVTSFMDLLFTNISELDLFSNVLDTFKKHPKVWHDNNNREIVVGLLTNIVSNVLLSDPPGAFKPFYIANIIVLLEYYDGEDEECFANHRIYYSPIISKKMRDLDPAISSHRRDVLKFYRKRTSCKCLKKMHLDARKCIPKTGICYGCVKQYERVSLSVCSRCMVMQYCSGDCKVANWPKHKRDCDDYVRRAQQQQHSLEG